MTELPPELQKAVRTTEYVKWETIDSARWISARYVASFLETARKSNQKKVELLRNKLLSYEKQALQGKWVLNSRSTIVLIISDIDAILGGGGK